MAIKVGDKTTIKNEPPSPEVKGPFLVQPTLKVQEPVFQNSEPSQTYKPPLQPRMFRINSAALPPAISERMSKLANEAYSIGNLLFNILANDDLLVLHKGIAFSEWERSFGKTDPIPDPEASGEYLFWFIQDTLASAEVLYKMGMFESGKKRLDLAEKLIKACFEGGALFVSVVNAKTKLQQASNDDEWNEVYNRIIEESKKQVAELKIEPRLSNFVKLFESLSFKRHQGGWTQMADIPPSWKSGPEAVREFDIASRINIWFYAGSPLEKELESLLQLGIPPNGKALVFNDPADGETYTLTKIGKFKEVVTTVPTYLEAWHYSQMYRRLGALIALTPLTTLREENPVNFEFPENEGSLIVVHDLFSKMDISQRKELSRKIGSTLVTGGKAVIEIQLKGPLYNRLLTEETTQTAEEGTLLLHDTNFGVEIKKYFLDLASLGKPEQGFDFDPTKFKVETKQLTLDQAIVIITKV